MALSYPARLSLAQLPTPLQLMQRASAEWGQGSRLWVKRDDLTGSVLSGNKLRKLEFVVAQARADGCDTLITCGGIQSNHCRATALVAAQLGMRCHLVLRGQPTDAPDGNLLLDYLAGAEISFYPLRQYQRELPDLLKQWSDHYAKQGHRAHVIPTGASDGLGIWGYIAAAEELSEDMDAAGIDRALWLTATGSGGTQAGLTLGAALHDAPAEVWGVAVCDDAAYFDQKARADIQDWEHQFQQSPPADLEIRTLENYVAPGYGRAHAEVFDTIARLARLEGLVLDPTYTGKAFHGLTRELAAGRFEEFEDIVFVHTGGVFGMFPQRQQFNFAGEQI